MDTNGGDKKQQVHEATNPLHLNGTHNTTAHPLQDIPIEFDDAHNDVHNDDDDDDLRSQQKNKKSGSKKNWVKFDDDADGNSKNNNNDDSGGSGSSSENTTQTALSATVAAKLAAPPTTRQARARTPTTTTTEIVAAAPVQRSTISSTSMPDVAPAVLTTESTHVNLNASGKTPQQQQQPHHPLRQQQQKPKPASVLAATSSQQQQQQQHHSNNNGTPSNALHKTTSVNIPVEGAAPPMRTIELSTGRIREGFANGDVIVTLLPANTKWPWITPAIFRPELVPEELMAQGLTLTVEEYVHAMETLVNDYRFTIYNVCYKRILVVWILFAFAVLLTLLFSGLQGVALFSLGVAWLFFNAAAIFLCMWVKLRLARGLEKCLARVNKQLMKHKILLILDDRGRISCHKVNLCFLYFDATHCVSYLNEFLEQTAQNGGEAIEAGWESKLDIDTNDIVIQGNTPVRLSRKQALAQEIFLSYLQRWGKDYLRRRLDWTVQEAGVHETPRHLQSSICPCQYEEEVMRHKIKRYIQQRRCFGRSCWI